MMGDGGIRRSRFRPAWWLPGPHAQTLWPALLRLRPKIDLSRERLELPDGDFVDLRWTQPCTGPLVAVFHGLEGGIGSHYTKPLLQALQASGWRAVLMHFRGCGGEPNRMTRSYHSGDTGDIAYLLEVLRERHPDRPLGAVGFSLGGNALLKYLGERQGGTPLAAAAAVSVPFDLAAGARRLKRGFSRVYQRHLIGRMQQKIDEKFRHMRPPPGFTGLERLPSLRNFHEFDEAITAPLHGFAGAEDYYARCSCKRFLRNIGVPTLIIHAVDDPFLTPDAVPQADDLSELVTLELSSSGGHVGFVGGALPGWPAYWLDRRIPEFLRDHLQ